MPKETDTQDETTKTPDTPASAPPAESEDARLEAAGFRKVRGAWRR